MEDKQIIDGEHDMNYCEDSNCKHYGKKEQCEKTHCYYRCYFELRKQLKRKEQECNLLKQAFKNKNIVAIVEENENLKAENEELKKKLTIAEDNFACEIQARLYHQNEQLKISKENEILKEKLVISSNADKQTIKIIKALDEIRDIAVDGRCFYDEIEQQDEREWFDQILDIINKAKEQ